MWHHQRETGAGHWDRTHVLLVRFQRSRGQWQAAVAENNTVHPPVPRVVSDLDLGAQVSFASFSPSYDLTAVHNPLTMGEFTVGCSWPRAICRTGAVMA
jgi:hypothetical protein